MRLIVHSLSHTYIFALLVNILLIIASGGPVVIDLKLGLPSWRFEILLKEMFDKFGETAILIELHFVAQSINSLLCSVLLVCLYVLYIQM